MKKSTAHSKSNRDITCIYCKQTKPSHLFNTEHVLPKAFGYFKQNLTLKNMVCEQCNSFFGKDLDIHLARGTPEALKRYRYSIKPLQEFSNLTMKQEINFRISSGTYQGVYLTPRYSKTHKELLFDLLPQIGFKKKNATSYDFFLIKDLPNKKSITENYDASSENGVIILPDTCQKDATIALSTIGINLKGGHSSYLDMKNRTIDIKTTWSIDDTIRRAISKIAFNYLAKFNAPELLQQKDFDIIRNYILRGEKPDYPLVHIDNTPILLDERNSKHARLGHIIALDPAQNQIIGARVSLFNSIRYSVILAHTYSGKELNLGFGNFFNIYTKEIMKLELRSSS